MASTWNAWKVLGVHNQDVGHVTCVGYAPTPKRRCRNVIAGHNESAARAQLEMLPATVSGAERAKILTIAASALLCQRNHQDQAENMVAIWMKKVAEVRPLSIPAIKIEKPESRRPLTREVSRSTISSHDSIFSNNCEPSDDESTWSEHDGEEIPGFKAEECKPKSDKHEDRLKRLSKAFVEQSNESREAVSKAMTAAAIARAEAEAIKAKEEAERKARIAAEDKLRQRELDHKQQAVQQGQEKLAAERELLGKVKKEAEVERQQIAKEKFEAELARERLRQEQISAKLEHQRTRDEQAKEEARLNKIRVETEDIKRQALDAITCAEHVKRTRSQTAAAKAEQIRKAKEEQAEITQLSVRTSLNAAWEFCPL